MAAAVWTGTVIRRFTRCLWRRENGGGASTGRISAPSDGFRPRVVRISNGTSGSAATPVRRVESEVIVRGGPEVRSWAQLVPFAMTTGESSSFAAIIAGVKVGGETTTTHGPPPTSDTKV